MHPQLAFISACLIDTQGSNEHDGKSGRGWGGGDPTAKVSKHFSVLQLMRGPGKGRWSGG